MLPTEEFAQPDPSNSHQKENIYDEIKSLGNFNTAIGALFLSGGASLYIPYFPLHSSTLALLWEHKRELGDKIIKINL